jgi:hypothetical protein
MPTRFKLRDKFAIDQLGDGTIILKKVEDRLQLGIG